MMRIRAFCGTAFLLAGELLKKGQLGPDIEKLKVIKPAQLELFGGGRQ